MKTSLTLQQRLLVIVVAAATTTCQAQNFARECSIVSDQPVKAVLKNQSTGLFEFADHVDIDSLNNYGRFNNNHKQLRQRMLGGGASSNQTQPQTGAFDYSVFVQGTELEPQLFLVRECPCVPAIFCTLEYDTCGIPTTAGSPYGCFRRSTRKTLLRNAWPLLLLWYTTLLFFVFFTEKGHHARRFLYLQGCGCLCIFRNCWCARYQRRHNQRMVDRFLYAHGFLSSVPETLQNSSGTNNEGSNAPTTATVTETLPVARAVHRHSPSRIPTALVLKTKTYGVDRSLGVDDTNNALEEDDEEDHTCTICFTPLEIGDRVGALPCSHNFHVDCLKSWLPRRNVCPLCQNTNAATPQYPEEEEQPQPADHNDDSGIPTARPTPHRGAVTDFDAPLSESRQSELLQHQYLAVTFW